MKKLLEQIGEEMVKAFETAGYEPSYAKVTVSNRPDLCEFQCNGAMAAAKQYRKAPIQIATAVVEALEKGGVIGEAEAVNPGFINLKLNPEALSSYLNEMRKDKDLSVEKA